MSYAKEREDFIARMSRKGMPLDVITALLRYASTLQRLAEAQCNGDYPYNVGRDRVAEQHVAICLECEQEAHKHTFKRPPQFSKPVCPDCYTTIKVKQLCPAAWLPVFGGDPRGAVLRLVPAGTSREDIDSGRERGIYVPAR